MLRGPLRRGAMAALLAPTVAAAQSIGANTRAYVSVNQLFQTSCASPGIRAGTGAWESGGVTYDCTFSSGGVTQIDGRTTNTQSARLLDTYTRMTVIDPSGAILTSYPTNSAGARSLTALARTDWVDQVLVSSAGATPTSVRFDFTLAGSVTSTYGNANTSIGHTANLGVGFGSTSSGPLAQNVVNAPGTYTRTFAFTSGMLNTWTSFDYQFINFATMSATTDYTQPIVGESVTDYSVKLDGLHFLDASGADITSSVNATFMSGADYTTTTPEPATLALTASGLFALGARVVRRRRAAA